MAAAKYGNNKGKPRERSIQDKEIVKAFIEELEGGKAAEEFLEDIGRDREVTATVEYRLHNEYSGDDFIYFATKGEEVEAHVDLYVEVEDSETMREYSNSIQYKATEIFHPEAIVDVEENKMAAENSAASRSTASTD